MTTREAVQLSAPCWLEALQLYSPLSALTGFTSSRAEPVLLLTTLYFSLCLISTPDLYHRKFTSGASDTSQWNLAPLPTFISNGAIFTLNTGGTKVPRERRGQRSATHSWAPMKEDVSGVTVKEKEMTRTVVPRLHQEVPTVVEVGLMGLVFRQTLEGPEFTHEGMQTLEIWRKRAHEGLACHGRTMKVA